MWVAGVVALSATGCDPSSPTGSDADIELDGGTDAGLPETCSTAGAIETVSCGSCGTVERFCTAAGSWAYGECTGESGTCVPGTVGAITCGNCGTQVARCTVSCTWEGTGTCGDEGECTPGLSTRSTAGCGAGETREVTCGDACVYEATTECAADACPTAGELGTAPCGMCGTIDRVCGASGTWEYGTCRDEGACRPGTSGTTGCGMCGIQDALCDASCTWVASDEAACTTEGVCAPGTTSRTSDGCPVGETRLARCDDACGYSIEVEACSASVPVDVIVVLDVTGSNEARLMSDVPTIDARCVGPLLAITGVNVGVAYAGEFPIAPYGAPADHPFVGGTEPGTSASVLAAALAGRPHLNGGDLQDALGEALSVLSGGALPATAIPMTCSSGRVAGGCWRPTAERVIVVHTDSPIHGGPDPASGAVRDPYVGISPPPAEWPAIRSQLTSTHTRLIFLDAGALPDASDQFVRMLDELGQPLSDRHAIATAGAVGACDQIVARVRAIAGR